MPNNDNDDFLLDDSDLFELVTPSTGNASDDVEDEESVVFKEDVSSGVGSQDSYPRSQQEPKSSAGIEVGFGSNLGGSQIGPSGGKVVDDPNGKLCPRCLVRVPNFVSTTENNGAIGYQCPHCRADIPIMFAQEYGRFPIVQFNLAGLTGNGKSCFLRGLFQQFEQGLPLQWPEFWYEPLSSMDGSILAGWKNDGLPNPNQNVVSTVGIRLHGIPAVGSADLLMFDISGEAFQDNTLLKSNAFHVQCGKVITLLISLNDTKNGLELVNMLGRLQDGLRAMGKTTQDKSLIVVLTKGDQHLNDPSLPEIALDFLERESSGDPLDSRGLKQMSDAVSKWVERFPGDFTSFVRKAQENFAHVRFTMISAIGFEPEGQNVDSPISPRNVVAPFTWLLRFTLPRVVVRTSKGARQFFSLSDAIDLAHKVRDEVPEVLLGEGNFRIVEGLKIRKPMKIRGVGKDVTRVFAVDTKFVLWLQGGDSVISDMTIEREGESQGSAVVISGGQFDISKCRFGGGRRIPGGARGRTFGNGLEIVETSQGSVIDCESIGNEDAGIMVTGSSVVSIKRCLIEGNAETGLRITDKARATVLKNKIINNGTRGIWMAGSCQFSIEGNTCSDNQLGILCEAETTGMISKNNVQLTGARSFMNEAGRPIKTAGIDLMKTASADVVNNTCQNLMYGIRIRGTSKPNVSRNISRSNHGVGILATENSGAVIQANTCSKNEIGIRVEASAQETKLKKNTTQANTGNNVADLRGNFWRRAQDI